MRELDTKNFNIRNHKLFARVNIKAENPLRCQKGDKRFLKGPIPLWWLRKAAPLPGKALVISTVLWFLSGVSKSKTVKLSGKLLREFGVSRSTSYRGIKELETAGLVSVKRHRGRNYLVTIII